MQTNVRARVIASLFALAAGVAVNVQAQYSAFTYQGRLNDGGNPATGSYELQFTLYDRATAGTVLGGPITNTVAASDGVFTTTLDFGLDAIRWVVAHMQEQSPDDVLWLLEQQAGDAGADHGHQDGEDGPCQQEEANALGRVSLGQA